MSIILYALIVLVIAAFCALLIQRIMPRYADIASVVVLLVAVIVIAQRAGIGL